MVLGPRIVFLIDRYQGDEENSKKVLANINLSCLRILCYYKHSLCANGSKPSISWGYKFFNSIKNLPSHRYKRGEFLEYVTSNFERFENDLYGGVCNDIPEENALPGEKIKVALTDLITEFQWDRPELFSPGKVWKGRNNYSEFNNNNMIFLFSNCPSSFNKYFDRSYDDHKSFIDCMFPNVLYTKFVKHSKIKLCWVDTGTCSINKDLKEKNHEIMTNGMRSINGSFLELRYLALWWIYFRQEDDIFHKDVVNVSSLMNNFIDSENDIKINVTKYNFTFNDSNDGILSLCNIYPGINKNTACIEENIKSMNFIDVVDIKSLMISTLCNNSSYFFAMNDMYTEGNNNLITEFKKCYFSSKCIKIQFSPPFSNDICNAVMILNTPFFGTIIELSDDNSNDKEIAKPEEDILDDITQEMNGQYHRILTSSKQDFNTSLVNSVDTWFLANPKLGCPPEVRSILCNICNDKISMKKRRDGNSKLLVEHIKGINSKSNGIKKFIKDSYCGKSRLKHYRKKLEDEKENINKVENNNENLENSFDQVFTDPVELPTEDRLKDIVTSEYEMLLQKSLSLTLIRNIFKIVIQYYKSNEPDSFKESSFSLLNSTIFNNVDGIRDKNIDTPKDELVKEYLTQVHLYLECVHQFSPPNTDPILIKIVSFLRTVSFEKSASFITKHLNEMILPQYPDMAEFLQEIYENLMIEFPEDLEESKEMDIDDESSIKSVESSLKSYCSSEYSPLSQQQVDKRTLRRKSSSVVGDNNSKKLIAVQVKKVNKDKVEKKKTDEKVVKRTLFTQESHTTKILTTPKANRRRSEPAAKQKVPDTPETSQKNDMMWKKLERKRRYSSIDKKMVTIDESPLKELASPIKRHSSFYRSSSFNCHTSPRRFYKMQRHPSMIVGSHGVKQGSFQGHQLDASDKLVSASPLEVKLRRRSTLFSNFDEDDKVDDNQNVPVTSSDDEKDTKTVSPKALIENTPVKQKSDSSRIECHISKRLKLSPGNELCTLSSDHTPDKKTRSKKRTRFNFELNTVIDNLDHENPVYMSETTVDWLSEIEKEQSNTPTNFHDALAKVSNTPVVTIQSPAVIKAGNESISVSPCLSASSIEVLEKAPIISPIVTKRKRRRGRLLKDEYE